LQQVHGNAATFHLYGITVTDGRRAEVTLNYRTVELGRRSGTSVIVRETGTQSLSSAQAHQLARALGQVNLAQVEAVRNDGGCHGAPIGDVGGNSLTIGKVYTDCPPDSAQPLVNWLETTAQQVPLRVVYRQVRHFPIVR
jgi:hypothetical protein